MQKDSVKQEPSPAESAAEAMAVVTAKQAGLDAPAGRGSGNEAHRAADAADCEPALVEEGFQGQFNIVQCGGTYYALSQQEGEFVLEKARNAGYRQCYSGSSVEEVKRRVAESAVPTRGGSYAFRAGSALPDDRIAAWQTDRIFLARYGNELYAISREAFAEAFPRLAQKADLQAATVDVRNVLPVRSVIPRYGSPELIREIGDVNVVRYCGRFYVIPQNCGAVAWGEIDPAMLPGAVEAATAAEAVSIARARLRSSGSRKSVVAVPAAPARSGAVPRLVKTVNRYNIVAYEGWYYGLPHALGHIQLDQQDVIEVPGVIRDLSIDVVEREILELG